MDLYRLKNTEEALDIGIEEYLTGDNYCFIEWPDLILDLLEDTYYVINITIEADQSRTIHCQRVIK